VKILFIGTTGVHHALVAANIFLGRLSQPDFSKIEGYADNYNDMSGYPILVNDDGKDNQVYTMGVGRELKVAHRAIGQFIELLGCSSKDLIVHPISVKGETLLLLLKILPEAFGGKIFNTFISNLVIKRQFSNISNDVNRFKEKLL
jgi:hypothetical protein